jgi:hypothetical protein
VLRVIRPGAGEEPERLSDFLHKAHPVRGEAGLVPAEVADPAQEQAILSAISRAWPFFFAQPGSLTFFAISGQRDILPHSMVAHQYNRPGRKITGKDLKHHDPEY